MRVRRLLANAALVISAAFCVYGCQDATRIEGKVTLPAGTQAPDSARHTLYVAAFLPTSLSGGVLTTGAQPVLFEFGGVANADFDPDVTYSLGGAGDAREVVVVAWWKVNEPELLEFAPPAAGDLFGVYAGNPVFPGATGHDKGATKRDVDVVLDRTY